LIKALQDPSAQIRSVALGVLSSFGAQAKPAIPALLDLQKDPNQGVARGQYFTYMGRWPPRHGYPIELGIHRHIEWVIENIDPEAAAKAGIK
jgi:hypothetical protein